MRRGRESPRSPARRQEYESTPPGWQKVQRAAFATADQFAVSSLDSVDKRPSGGTSLSVQAWCKVSAVQTSGTFTVPL